MKTTLRILSSTLLVLLLGASHAQADESADLAKQAIEQSGTAAALAGLGDSLNHQMADAVKSLSEKQRAEFQNLLKETMDGGRLTKQVTDAIAATGDQKNLRAAIAAMRNPLFQRVNRQIDEETLKTTDADLVAYGKASHNKLDAKRRAELLKRLDAATGASRALVDLRCEVANKAWGNSLSDSDRKAKLAELRKQLELSAPSEYVLRNLYATRNISLKDLESYVKTSETEPMRWFAHQLVVATQHTIVDAVGLMARKAAELRKAGGNAPAATPPVTNKAGAAAH